MNATKYYNNGNLSPKIQSDIGLLGIGTRTLYCDLTLNEKAYRILFPKTAKFTQIELVLDKKHSMKGINQEALL